MFHRHCQWDAQTDTVTIGYHIGSHMAKQAYIMRMTRRHYFGLRSKYPVGSMMWNLYTHKACSYDLYNDILDFWGWREE